MSNNNVFFRLGKYVYHLFSPRKSSRDIQEQKMRADYEFLRLHGVETELGYVTLLGKPIIHKYPRSRIIIGKGVTLISETQYNLAGINHPCVLSTMAEGAEIVIGDNAGMSGTSVVAVRSVRIGDETLLGANTNVYDTDFHCIDAIDRIHQKSITEASAAPIIIGKRVWVGANSTILKGVKLGDNVVVGANSLVNSSMNDNVVCAGNPAIVRKYL